MCVRRMARFWSPAPVAASAVSLARRGYTVVASTGRPSEEQYLNKLGAASIVDRARFSEKGAPLQPERWTGAVDTVGSHTLANVCATLKYGGTVAATGIAQGAELPATMYPLALRGITICGIDSVYAPLACRKEAWRSLEAELDLDLLAAMTATVPLADVVELAPAILAGQIRGRVVVEIPS